MVAIKANIRSNIICTLSGFIWSVIAVFLAVFLPMAMVGLFSWSIFPVEQGLGFGFFAVIFAVVVFIIWGFPAHLIFICLILRKVDLGLCNLRLPRWPIGIVGFPSVWIRPHFHHHRSNSNSGWFWSSCRLCILFFRSQKKDY